MRGRHKLNANVPNSVSHSGSHSTYAPFDNHQVRRYEWAKGTTCVEDDDGRSAEEAYLQEGTDRRMALQPRLRVLRKEPDLGTGS